MSDERAVFASTVLVERTPVDASSIFISRLLESKGLNNQLGSFLFDYMMINRHYTSKLKKILDSKGRNLNQLIEQYVKKESKNDPQYAGAQVLSNDHLGNFSSLWNGILDDINQEIIISETFCNNMEKQLISPLKKCFDISKNKKYNNMLLSILDLNDVAATANGESSEGWAVKSPQVAETFENFEYNRLLFLKDAFLSFQTNLNHKFNENLKHNENLFSVLVGFSPDEEIQRFAYDASKLKQPANGHVESSDSDAEVNSPPIANKLSSTPKLKKTGTSDLAPPALPALHLTKSNPSTLNSQDGKKRLGLRSKVGTLFGRRKHKKRQDSISSELVEEHEVKEPPAAASEAAANGTNGVYQEPKLFDKDINPRSSFIKEEKTENGAENAPPPPPPTRKTAGLTDNGPKKRKDIQSKLFTNLTQAAIMDAGANQNQNQERLSFINEGPKEPTLPPLPKNASYSISEASRKHSMDSSGPVALHGNASTTSLNTRAGTSKFFHPEFVDTGLNVSISELLKVTLRDGVAENCQIIGEIGITYLAPVLGRVPDKSYIKLVDRTHLVEKFIPNHSLLELLQGSNDDDDEKVFAVNPSLVTSRTLGGIKYLIASHAESPVSIIPVWRFEPHQASCMLSIQLSEHIQAALGPGDVVQLDNFILSVALEDNGVDVVQALSKPTGTFNKEKRRIIWKFDKPIVLSHANQEEKILARFQTKGLAQESKKGAQAKFVINNKLGAQFAVSPIEVKFNTVEHAIGSVSELNGHWTDASVAKTLAINSFTAHSI